MDHQAESLSWTTYKRVRSAFNADQGTNNIPLGDRSSILAACEKDVRQNRRAMTEDEASNIFAEAGSTESKSTERAWPNVTRAVERMF